MKKNYLKLMFTFLAMSVCGNAFSNISENTVVIGSEGGEVKSTNILTSDKCVIKENQLIDASHNG